MTLPSVALDSRQIVPSSITIPRRFNGPPNSANGGYVCGCAARALGGPADVSLRSPPPLELAIDIVRDESGVRLRAGARDVVEGIAGEPNVTPPPAPTLAEAEWAAENFLGFTQHSFPGCFVCGTARAEGDGLRIFTGALRDGLVAAPWKPSGDLAESDGRVGEEFLWAALDCPTYWGLPRAGSLTALLARMCARIDARPRADETVIVAGWALGSSGRKHRGASALYDTRGRLLARAEALWIDIDPGEEA